jgi:hypothetical protein
LQRDLSERAEKERDDGINGKGNNAVQKNSLRSGLLTCVFALT